MITTIDEALAVLKTYIPKPGQMHHNYQLERMRQLMDLLNNPQESYKVIHIAGTSGKTSTAYFVQGLLQAAGKRTGLTVSPHIQSITERVQINGAPISDDTFVLYLNELLGKVRRSGIQPTYFELLVALAYMAFRGEKIEYAIVETGLGGLLDGTNIVTRPDKVCVITDIGLDHTEVLGETMQEIALQKAGIVQAGNSLILQHQSPEIEKVISDEAFKRGAADVTIVSARDTLFELPTFQRRNWMAATATYDYVAKRDNLPVLSEMNTHEAMLHQPPGRMEIFRVGDKQVIMDGAHNQQKLHALIEALQEKKLTPLNVLVSFVSDKQYQLEECLRELKPITKELVITDFSVLRDVGRSASSAQSITAAAKEMQFQSVTELTHPKEALDRLLSLHGQTVLVTGSLYLVAQLRDVIQNADA